MRLYLQQNFSALSALVKNCQANLGLLNYCFEEKNREGYLERWTSCPSLPNM